MSAYIKLNTPMLDKECLVSAITDTGFKRKDLTISDTPSKLQGWQAGESANIILKREYTGDSYNDIGFKSTERGYIAILSDDHPKYGRNWLSEISSYYEAHWKAKQDRLDAQERVRIEEERKRLVESQRKTVYERARKMGYRVRETKEGDSIRMVLLKRTY